MLSKWRTTKFFSINSESAPKQPDIFVAVSIFLSQSGKFRGEFCHSSAFAVCCERLGLTKS